jgi:hypothetical protein
LHTLAIYFRSQFHFSYLFTFAFILGALHETKLIPFLNWSNIS